MVIPAYTVSMPKKKRRLPFTGMLPGFSFRHRNRFSLWSAAKTEAAVSGCRINRAELTRQLLFIGVFSIKKPGKLLPGGLSFFSCRPGQKTLDTRGLLC